MRNIPIIIPAYEPDDRMVALINDIRKIYDGLIIIVNDGSDEKYNYIFDDAEKQGAIVLNNYVNLGKGRALKNAFNYCLNTYKDLVGCVTADSDGQHTPTDILRCMDALENNQKSLVLGCRNFDDASVPWKSKCGNKITRKVCQVLAGLKITDTQTGLRGIPAEFMAELLNVEGERFEFETRMLIASKNKYNIEEIEIDTVYDSKENHQTHFDPIKDSIKIYKIFGGMLVKFCISSGSSAVIDLLLFHLFTQWLSGRISAYIIVATILARILSALYNYLINHKVVFDSKKKCSNTLWKYAILAVVIMISSAFLVSTLYSLVGFLPEVIVKIVVDTLLFFVSYYIQHEYIFN